MKVLFIRPVLNNYGVTKVLIQLATELRRRGNACIIASENDDRFKKEVEKRGIYHYNIPIGSDRKTLKRFIISAISIAKIIKSEKIDLVHSHHRWSSFVCYFVTKLYKVPLVTTYHGIHEGKRRLTIWGDKIICVSDNARQHLIDWFRLDPKRVEVIYNGIEMPDLEKIEEIKKTLNMRTQTSSYIIANIARLSPEKDQKLLFYSFKKVLENYPQVFLCLVGSGPIENELKTLAVKLGIFKNILFLGELDDVSQILICMDFLVLSSKSEGLPLSILEALSYGKPVVATAVGGIPKIVKNNVNGMLVQPGDSGGLSDAIKFMIENKCKMLEMGQRARKSVEGNFSIIKMAVETEKVYLSVLL